ncbi:retrovirus-related pol polyprotein from transposon TNT 1-94 [Tanacetum coccineum]|uniref:Retrovirus-related pol polyprotein from transposon TNT 1-94 n=1 Tax=Tanacetum coccineum TaxID=301880 RepID=A0ABQ5DZY2_9ASTR
MHASSSYGSIWTSQSNKKNTLVIINEYSRMVEKQNDVKVKQIRTDNETEFRNSELGSFCDEKGYSFVFKDFRVFNTRKQQIEETYRVTFDESMEAIRFTNALVDKIGIDDLSSQPTKESSGNNTETSVPITEPLVPEVPQSQNTHLASISSYPIAQGRWSKDQHIELVNIIGEPGEGILIRSMAAKLIVVSASDCLFADFLSEIEPKKVSEALKHPGWVDVMQEELNQFYINKVWTLVPLSYRKMAIGSK